jgi:acyl-coenzyme A thioesterase PaaI-like protein
VTPSDARLTPSDKGEADDAPVSPERQSRRELAASIRSLVADVVDRDLDESEARNLLADVEDLRKRVVGPRRPRYYEQGLGEAARITFIDFSAISGLAHPFGIPMLIEAASDPEGAPCIRARANIGLAHEGPPHGVHGGVISAIFDELLGHAQQVHKTLALTASLTIRYRSITPLDKDLEFFAQVTHGTGKRWNGRATCSADDKVTAEAEALFIAFDLSSLSAR